MADLLRRWCNDELHLSRQVEDFERDFSNGFLLGEILSKFGKQSNFSEFLDSENPKQILGNFTRLVRHL